MTITTSNYIHNVAEITISKPAVFDDDTRAYRNVTIRTENGDMIMTTLIGDDVDALDFKVVD